MAWIRSDVSLPMHPKTKRLARLLDIPVVQVIGHLHALWYWCYEYAPDGDLSHFDVADIAEAAMWEGDAETFINALLECGPGDKAGFLERDPEGRLRVHDWEEYAGKLIEQRERARERAKRWREQQARNAHARRTNRGRTRTNDERTSSECEACAYATSTYDERTPLRTYERTNEESSTSQDTAEDEKVHGRKEGGSGGKPTASSTLAILTDHQRMALEVLRSVPLWPADDERDAQLLTSLAEEFPDVNLLAEAKAWRTYKLDRPLSKQSNPRLQFRNWVRIAHERRGHKAEAAPAREPAADGGQEGSAWERGWRPYYRKITEEELARYRGEAVTQLSLGEGEAGHGDA